MGTGVMKKDANKLLFAVDMAGTLVFAIEGATAAPAGNLDLLGVMVLAFATALALFAVAGTEKALEFNIHPFIAILLGGMTAVGGGTLRDILLARVPLVLRAEVYATAALAGSALLIIGRKLRLSPTQAAVLGGTFCFLLRLVSVWQHWNLPKAVGN